MDKVTVLMIEVLPNLWRIESDKGFILQDEIYCYGLHKAAEYVKNYVSSFSCWQYELKPMESK